MIEDVLYVLGMQCSLLSICLESRLVENSRVTRCFHRENWEATKSSITAKALFSHPHRFNKHTINVEQLVQKVYYLIRKNNSLELFDRTQRLVLKYHLAKNITFQASMMTEEMRCTSSSHIYKQKKTFYLQLMYLTYKCDWIH